jgi:hypothetical protein
MNRDRDDSFASVRPASVGRLLIASLVAVAAGVIGFRLTFDSPIVAATLWPAPHPAAMEAAIRWFGVACLAVCQGAAVAGPVRAVYPHPGTVERAIAIAAAAVGVLAVFGAAVLALSRT